MAAPTPVFRPRALGTSAAPEFITQPPNTNDPATGRASFALGFPPLTMTPVVAGGKPPFGQDVNGILYMLSTWAVAQQGGQWPKYSAQVATAIGGYALGAVLTSADGLTQWQSIASNNTSDPDAGGASWVPFYSYGFATVSGLAGGVRNLTAAEQAKSFIVLSGTLGANQAVVISPTRPGPWTIINLTTGAFALTVRTGGSGVVIPQGGYGEPVSVYCDGTNIQPLVAPLTIPSAVTPTADTYAVRSNAGYLYATYFNMNGAPEPSTPLAEVGFFNGSDGFLRRMPLANFLPTIFNNAALIGVPTAPTAAPGNASIQIATTAFVSAARGYNGIVSSGGAGIALPAGWSVSRSALGRYTVTHNLGLATPYGVQATMYNVPAPSRVQVATVGGANSFTVSWYSQTDSTYSDQPFQFSMGLI